MTVTEQLKELLKIAKNNKGQLLSLAKRVKALEEKKEKITDMEDMPPLFWQWARETFPDIEEEIEEIEEVIEETVEEVQEEELSPEIAEALDDILNGE